MNVSPARTCPLAALRILATLCCACLDGGFAGSLGAGEPVFWTGSASSSEDSTFPQTARTGTESPASLGSASPIPTRMLEADELTLLLTQALQTRVGSQSGQLEVQLLRPWTPIKVPDQPLTLLLREMPVTGLSPQCIIRFELRARERSLGSWQTAVQLRLWREVWVARATIRRGTPLSEADLVRERRDVLPFREPLAELDNFGGSELEFCDVVPAGAPILARALRPRPVLRKGQTAEAILEEGALRISLRVEVLEEGAPGQLIRVRNPLSRRDLYARVVDAQTLRVSL